MTHFLYIILGILAGVVAAFTVGYMFLRFARRGPHEEQGVTLLQNQLHELSRMLDQKISEGYKFVHESTRHQNEASQRLIKEITEELTSIKETNKQVVSFADQLQSLQDILQNPKRRGVLGEYYLETVLKNVLPPSVYKMQYSLGKDENGAELVVDAAIFVQDKIIPIDSKFSLENYNRLAEEKNPAERERLERVFKQDLKSRIDETSKYIQPEKGTMDFALMFIPSEAIFYDLIIQQVGAVRVNTDELIQYAARKRVNIVSPNSFYAFLQVILQGLNQLKIEKNTEIIRKRVGELGKHLAAYEVYLRKLGNTLGTTVNHYNAAYKEFGKIDKDIVKISGEKIESTPDTLARPETD